MGRLIVPRERNRSSTCSIQKTQQDLTTAALARLHQQTAPQKFIVGCLLMWVGEMQWTGFGC